MISKLWNLYVHKKINLIVPEGFIFALIDIPLSECYAAIDSSNKTITFITANRRIYEAVNNNLTVNGEAISYTTTDLGYICDCKIFKVTYD